MRLFRTKTAIILESAGTYNDLGAADWDTLVNRDDLFDHLHAMSRRLPPVQLAAGFSEAGLLPPIGSQEIWAAGVTYLRSKEARMKEAEVAGGGDFYDKVYDAERPELFFKAPPGRAVGHHGAVRIRRDSTWSVPEPELTLFITSGGKIVGYTIGNDMSSRSIEGENPLYLPQAKTYEKSAGLGPCLYVPEEPLPSDTNISMQIRRSGKLQYEGSAPISRMKRTHAELVRFLYRECEFPHGCFLMTGTCLVPPDDFTLRPNDEISITIDGIGTLVNRVEQKGE